MVLSNSGFIPKAILGEKEGSTDSTGNRILKRSNPLELTIEN